nr:hypothetical protein [Tanacetum cinerariifolium]
MTTLKFADTYNMVVFLSKPTESDGFEQIVDFLNAHLIRYASTVNPTIYISCTEQFWSTALAKTINEEVQIHARVDGKEIVITESSVRRDLQLADEEGIDCLPFSTIFEQLALTRKPKRKDTQVPQPNGPTDNVIDDAIHKELGDRLMRAATTVSSIKPKHDSGNITKIQSKATPNESSSQGTNSGGGPRVLDLEKTKTSQCNETNSLKRRVKKLEKRNRSRTHKLKRLYKVSLTAKIKSSNNEESLGEDASKQGRRIDAIDADDEITLVNNADNEMFDVDDLGGKEVFVTEQEVVNTAAITETITTEEITLAQALKALKTSKPKVKGIVFHEPDLKLKEFDSIKEMFDRAFRRVNTFEYFRTESVKGNEKRAREELIQKSTKKKKVEDDKEKAELKQLMETIPDKEKVAIDAIPLAVKSPRIVDWKIYKEN